MIEAINEIVLLAQTSQPTTQSDGGGGLLSNPMTLWIGLLLFLVVFMFMSGRGKKREQQERQRMLEQLGKNTKVVTFGGIIGTIVDVKDDELTLKVDESSNTKMKMKKWAIRAVVPREGDEPEEKKQ